MATVSHSTPEHVPRTGTYAPAGAVSAAAASWGPRLLAALRLVFGLTFLWAFLDKVFGLGFATPADRAWIRGGSPTAGFLGKAAKGPFAGFYHSIAGAVWADWLFMLGLLGIGAALTLGIGMRLAAIAAAVLYLMMWSAVLPPENHPFLDDHIVGALSVILLAVTRAGDTWGLGRWWAGTGLARRLPILR